MKTLSPSENSGRAQRAIIIVLDGVGCGELPDAADFGDVGSDSLSHVAKKFSQLKLPTLERWGLGALTDMKPAVARPTGPAAASYGKMAELSLGKDTTSGHWEMVGNIVSNAFTTYPNGFSEAAINQWIQLTGIPGVLGNCAASGTEIIKTLGEESMRSGKPILYTSADSVWQVAAHEESFGLARLYDVCLKARKICDELKISRVIARPFTGTSRDSFVRTGNRKDYSQTPPEKTMMEYLADHGLNTLGVGKIWNIFNGRGITESLEAHDNDEGMETLSKVLSQSIPTENHWEKGCIFVNLIDFDMLYGHRRDVPGYANSLMKFDAALTAIQKQLKPTDVVFITSDHGNDPSYRGTDHTREFVPLLVHRPGRAGNPLGVRKSFADLGQSVIHALTGKPSVLPVGQSFWELT